MGQGTHILISHQTFVQLVQKYVSALVGVLLIKTCSLTRDQSLIALMQTTLYKQLFMKRYCKKSS